MLALAAGSPLAGAWKQFDAHAWESTDRMGGKVLGTDTLKVSRDGKTLAEAGTRAGVQESTTAVYERQRQLHLCEYS